MRSYSEIEVFNATELDLMQKAAYLVAKFPDVENLRCHEVARAVGDILCLQVQDGHYGIIEHSWLWTKPWKPGTYPPSILDVYSVGSLPQVRLVDVNCIGLPHMSAYKPGKERKDINWITVKNMIDSISR